MAVKVLQGYISEVPFLKLQQTFKDALPGFGIFRRSFCGSLFFLDIHLPKLKGMDFLRTLNFTPAVIVTSAYHQYAVEGYELNVIDYLLKPIEFDRFLAAVNKVQVAANRSHRSGATDSKAYIYLNLQKKKVKVAFSDILYLESQREYVKVVTTHKTLTTKMSTHKIESLLPNHLFVRVHRSFIVSLPKIESYSADTVVVGGNNVPIGRNYKHVVEQF